MAIDELEPASYRAAMTQTISPVSWLDPVADAQPDKAFRRLVGAIEVDVAARNQMPDIRKESQHFRFQKDDTQCVAFRDVGDEWIYNKPWPVRSVRLVLSDLDDGQKRLRVRTTCSGRPVDDAALATGVDEDGGLRFLYKDRWMNEWNLRRALLEGLFFGTIVGTAQRKAEP